MKPNKHNKILFLSPSLHPLLSPEFGRFSMAVASAASFAAPFSALYVDSCRQNSQFLSSRKFPFPLSKLTPTTVLSTPAPRLPSLRASSDFMPVDPEEINAFDPTMEEYDEPSEFDEDPLESAEEIARAYEEIYGPAYSGESFLGNDVYVMDSKLDKSTTKNEKVRDEFDERVVQVRRVTKVVKGGKQMHFRAIVVVGDKQGNVGVGVGKAKEVTAAVQKSAVNARRNIITVPMTKYKTFPHRSEAKYGAAKVMLRPAAPGTGVIAGGSVRIVLEMAGVENALGKQLGSNNALNNARATVEAVLMMRQFSQVAEERGIPMEELWK